MGHIGILGTAWAGSTADSITGLVQNFCVAAAPINPPPINALFVISLRLLLFGLFLEILILSVMMYPRRIQFTGYWVFRKTTSDTIYNVRLTGNNNCFSGVVQ